MNFKNENFFLKYSNSTLFEKRELQSKNKQSKTILNTKSFSNKGINNKQKINTIQKFPQKKLKKAESFPLLLNSLSTFQTFYTINAMSRNSSLKNLTKFTSRKYSPHRKTPHLNLNEEELLNNNIIFNSEEETLKRLNSKKDKYEKIFETDFFPKTPDYKDRKKTDNIDFLLSIQKEVNKYRKMKKEKINYEINLKNLKLNNLNIKEYGAKKVIKKANNNKFLKFMNSLKKERVLSINEEYFSKVDSIQEKINTIKDSINLFNIEFLTKLSNYIRFLDSIKDKEKKNNLLLLKEKMKYEQNIVQLNTEIEKMQVKKNQIIKWIYLQIKVREKKLVLPNFYKIMIESNKSKILSLQSKFYEKDVFKRESKKEINKKNSSKIKNIYLPKKSIVSNSLFKKTNEKIGSGKSNKKIKNINNIKESNSSNKVISLIINNIKEYITKEDFDKVLFWRYSPIFKTSEEFIETLKSFDSQNIFLLKYYNQIQSKIFDSLNELRKIINSKDKTNILENQIKDKTNELEKIKNRYKNLYKIYSNIKEDNNIKRNPKYDISTNDSKNNKPKININKIYFKINYILDHCKIINNEKLIELLDYNRKKSNSKEEEIIYIFEYIECTIDYLLEKIRIYKRDENKNELLQKIMYEIEKKHKREIPDKQRLEDLEKSIKLLKKLESKNNKVFLNNRKIDYFYFELKNKKGLDLLNQANKNKDDFPTLEEFLKNVNIINDIYSDNSKIIRRMSKKKTSKRKKENIK